MARLIFKFRFQNSFKILNFVFQSVLLNEMQPAVRRQMHADIQAGTLPASLPVFSLRRQL